MVDVVSAEDPKGLGDGEALGEVVAFRVAVIPFFEGEFGPRVVGIDELFHAGDDLGVERVGFSGSPLGIDSGAAFRAIGGIPPFAGRTQPPIVPVIGGSIVGITRLGVGVEVEDIEGALAVGQVMLMNLIEEVGDMTHAIARRLAAEGGIPEEEPAGADRAHDASFGKVLADPAGRRILIGFLIPGMRMPTMNFRFQWVWCLLAAGPLAAFDGAAFSRELGSFVEGNEGVVGMAVAVFDADSIQFAEAFGWADREAHSPYTVETVQPVASVSKTLIGYSLVRAAELGHLNLDEPVASYLPFDFCHPRHPEIPITFRHLATHTAGIKDTDYYDRSYVFAHPIPPLQEELGFGLMRVFVGQAIERYNANQQMPVESFLARLYSPEGEWYERGNFTRDRPGKDALYSNMGAALAALALERAVGVPYRDFVVREILKPLGMTSSGWRRDDFEEGTVATLYIGGYELPPYELITYADGGFFTCLSDLTVYVQEAMRGEAGRGSVLGTGGYRDLFGGRPGEDSAGGLFWDVNERMAGHTGGDPGVSTFAYFKRDGSRGLVILFNSSDWEISEGNLEAVMAISRKY